MDIASGHRFALIFWWLPALALVASGAMRVPGAILTAIWTASLLVMGIGCVINARRCGRTHCYFTGPFFVVMAALVALHGSGILSLGEHGWQWLWNTLLAGGLLLYFLPEWLWGRYRR